MNLGAAPIFREIKILVLQRSSIYVLVMVKAVTVASGIFGQVQSLVRFLIEVVRTYRLYGCVDCLLVQEHGSKDRLLCLQTVWRYSAKSSIQKNHLLYGYYVYFQLS